MSRRRRIRVGALPLVPVFVGAVGAAELIRIALRARPIADDWWFISGAQQMGLGTYLHYNLGSSGRFSQFTLAWLFASRLGGSADSVLPLALFALSLPAAAWALRELGALNGAPAAWLDTAGASLLMIVAAVATAPSLYDTLAWFAAATSYLGAAVATLILAALLVAHIHADRWPWWVAVPGLALGAALVGGFQEILGVVVGLGGVLALLTVRDLRPTGGRRATIAALAVVLGASVGTGANVVGPGAQERAAAQHAHLSVTAALSTASHNLSFVTSRSVAAVLMLAIAAGIQVHRALGPTRDRRTRRWLGLWSTFLVTVPWLVTAALTAWAGSTESGDRSPFRAGFIGTSSVALGLVGLTWLLLSTYPRPLPLTSLTVVATLLSSIGVIAIAHRTGPLLRAETMRATRVAARVASVDRQLAERRSTVSVDAAPLLTVDTQAYDLSFSPAPQRSGWVSALRDFYGIPASTRVRVKAAQPPSYCLPNVTAPWVGVRSCTALHRF